MSRHEARATEIAIAALHRQLLADRRLQAEVQRARRQFFGASTPGGSEAAEQRFAEWFALERQSEVLGAVPVDVQNQSDQVGNLLGSRAGAFLVVGQDGEEATARDLQGDELLDLTVPAQTLAVGDLLVGRLFAQDGGTFLPSSCAAVFRPGEALGLAFQRDVERVGLDRRLQQIELEHLLLRRPDQTPSPTAAVTPAAPLEHLEAELESVLQAGRSSRLAAAISEELAAAATPGPVLGPLLEELAFDTTVDLDRVRALVLEIWNGYHTLGSPPANAGPAASPGATLGERVANALDEGLAQKRPVEDVFAQLEHLAGLEPGAADDAENPFDREDGDDGAGDAAPGNLGPMVQEYLWETGREAGEATSTLHLWVELQASAGVPTADLEQITGTDLMRLLLHVYLGAGPATRAAEVRSACAELQEFGAWALRTQEIDLGPALQGCKGSLLDELDRLAAASLLLSTEKEPDLRPGILRIEDLGPQGLGVSDDDGGDHWLQCSANAAAQLRVGDLVLGALGDGAGGRCLRGLVVVLPADARALIE